MSKPTLTCDGRNPPFDKLRANGSEPPLHAMLDHAALSALNHLLAGADWARARLAPFAGRTLRLAAAPLDLALVVDSEGYVAASGAADFDVTITLPAATPLRLLEGIDAAIGDARIEGSVDFANTLGFVLRNLRWDYEEDLSKLVGDIAAHRIAAQLGGLFRWQREAARNLAENLVEYYTEEQPLIAKPDAVAAFASDVKALDAGITALETRLARLANDAK